MARAGLTGREARSITPLRRGRLRGSPRDVGGVPARAGAPGDPRPALSGAVPRIPGPPSSEIPASWKTKPDRGGVPGTETNGADPRPRRAPELGRGPRGRRRKRPALRNGRAGTERGRGGASRSRLGVTPSRGYAGKRVSLSLGAKGQRGVMRAASSRVTQEPRVHVEDAITRLRPDVQRNRRFRVKGM